MKNCKLKEVSTPVEKIADPLTELLRNGARDLIRQAVEAELSAMLSEYEDYKLLDGRQAIVRNGYLPERTIQTGVGDVSIKVPKVRDLYYRLHWWVHHHQNDIPNDFFVRILLRRKALEWVLDCETDWDEVDLSC